MRGSPVDHSSPRRRCTRWFHALDAEERRELVGLLMLANAS
jgi:hypothetical protein